MLLTLGYFCDLGLFHILGACQRSTLCKHRTDALQCCLLFAWDNMMLGCIIAGDYITLGWDRGLKCLNQNALVQNTFAGKLG